MPRRRCRSGRGTAPALDFVSDRSEDHAVQRTHRSPGPSVASRATHRALIAAWLAALFVCGTHAAEPSPIGALRAKFSNGIPWRVEFTDSAGKSLGAIDMRITSARGQSCLGDMNPDGVRVEFVRKDNLSPTLSITS